MSTPATAKKSDIKSITYRKEGDQWVVVVEHKDDYYMMVAKHPKKSALEQAAKDFKATLAD